MRIYFDIDNCRHTNGRGVPTNEPVTLTQGSIPEIDVVFLHNGGVVIPELRALSLRLGKVGSACLTSTNVYTTGAGGVHTLHLDLSSDAVASALSGDSWTAAVGNGSARTYSFANSSAEPALLRAVGFRVAIGSVYIPSGLFSIDTVARTVTLDASVVPVNGTNITVYATVPEAALTLSVVADEISDSRCIAVTANASPSVLVPTTVGIFVGAAVTGPGIPANTTVTHVSNLTAFTMSAAATITGSRVLNIQRAYPLTLPIPARLLATTLSS